MTKDFTEFEKRIGTSFKNKALLQQAFTHRSYLNENRASGLEHNERLEFLGDAVLGLIVTDYLYKKYPEKPEGELTAFRSALVNFTTLSEAAAKLGFNDYLLLSRGETKDTGRARTYILANTFEAFVGALHLDQGYEAAAKFIGTELFHLIDTIIEKGSWIDAKSQFQEAAQDRVGVTPVYKTTKETGPDHDRHFTVGVYLGGEFVASGEGRSKQDAEQEAARKALEEKHWD